MATHGGKELALAKVYATALLELARAANQPDAWGEELRGFAALVERDAGLATFLASPTVTTATRAQMIEKLLRGKCSEGLVDALQVLNRNERLPLVREVAEAYHRLLEEWKDRVEVQVHAAMELTEALRSRLRNTLARTTGKQVDLIECLDESLIGGLVVQIGDDKYDNSVRRKLHAVGQRLLERASKEIHGGRTFSVGAGG